MVQALLIVACQYCFYVYKELFGAPAAIFDSDTAEFNQPEPGCGIETLFTDNESTLKRVFGSHAYQSKDFTVYDKGILTDMGTTEVLQASSLAVLAVSIVVPLLMSGMLSGRSCKALMYFNELLVRLVFGRKTNEEAAQSQRRGDEENDQDKPSTTGSGSWVLSETFDSDNTHANVRSQIISAVEVMAGRWYDSTRSCFLVDERCVAYAKALNFRAPAQTTRAGKAYREEMQETTAKGLAVLFLLFPIGAVVTKAIEYLNSPDLDWGHRQQTARSTETIVDGALSGSSERGLVHTWISPKIWRVRRWLGIVSLLKLICLQIAVWSNGSVVIVLVLVQLLCLVSQALGVLQELRVGRPCEQLVVQAPGANQPQQAAAAVARGGQRNVPPEKERAPPASGSVVLCVSPPIVTAADAMGIEPVLPEPHAPGLQKNKPLAPLAGTFGQVEV
jgi:hypothetical protein